MANQHVIIFVNFFKEIHCSYELKSRLYTLHLMSDNIS